MNTETVLIFVRAAVIALGTLAVQRGWVTADQEHTWSGQATVWITGGIVTLGPALLGSWWGRKRKAAMAKLAAMMPEGTSTAMVTAALANLTRSSILTLSKDYDADHRGQDLAQVAQTVEAIRLYVQQGEPAGGPPVNEVGMPALGRIAERSRAASYADDAIAALARSAGVRTPGARNPAAEPVTMTVHGTGFTPKTTVDPRVHQPGCHSYTGGRCTCGAAVT